MRCVFQRVSESRVQVDGKVVGQIGHGALILLGVGRDDSEQDVVYLADKVAGLRVFEDTAGKMNCSLLDIKGSALVVSQFTLYGDCTRGRRPGFSEAAPPHVASPIYERFCDRLRAAGVDVHQGVFQADMQVHLVNDGPVTLLLESRR